MHLVIDVATGAALDLMADQPSSRVRWMAASRTRRLGRWFVGRRDESDPVVAWSRLPRDIRTWVVHLSWSGQPHPYPNVRATAAAWGAAVGARSLLWSVVREVPLYVAGAGLGALLWGSISGHGRLWYFVGSASGGTIGRVTRIIFVRFRARRVLRANGAAQTNSALATASPHG